MMLNGTIGNLVTSIGKVVPGSGQGLISSIDNGYGSQTSNFASNQQGNRQVQSNQRGQVQGPLSNAGSFYSNMGGVGPQGSANYEKVQAKYALNKANSNLYTIDNSGHSS